MIELAAVAFKAGRFRAAADGYSAALARLAADRADLSPGLLGLQGSAELEAALLCNRAVARLKRKDGAGALRDATRSLDRRPRLPKGHYRLAQVKSQRLPPPALPRRK